MRHISAITEKRLCAAFRRQSRYVHFPYHIAIFSSTITVVPLPAAVLRSAVGSHLVSDRCAIHHKNCDSTPSTAFTAPSVRR
jgi:hypothetical protein